MTQEHASQHQVDPDDLTFIPMSRIIADVRACINGNISVAGLSLALTIPDILGQQAYPDLTFSDGDRNVGAQYARWFDKWVAREFVDKLHWFTGSLCYELRCSLLHSGTAQIEYEHVEQQGVRYNYSFELVDDGAQSHVEHTSHNGRERDCRVHINADTLAGDICDGAERYLASIGRA